MKLYKNYKLITDSADKKGLFKIKNLNNRNLAVFVHGFTGNYLSTWGDFPKLLTNDPRLSDYDFLFWGYSSDLIVPKQDFILENIKQLFIQFLNKHKTNQPIETIAQGLQTELKYLDEYDNITLIGHSLGGLIIRSYIIQNLREGKNENLDRINKIRQIILFGTPNEGLDIANSKLLNSFNNQIYDVGSYNEFINALREEWVERVFKDKSLNLPTIMVAGEDDYFVPIKQVTKYFRDSREITRGDHNTMVRPKSVNDMTYKIVANNLLNVRQSKAISLPNYTNTSQNIGYSEYSKRMLEKIRKMVADRGLDEKSWSQVLPAQYFLVKLARLLNLKSNSDYKNLLNLFLKSFYMTVDNRIVLLKETILDTDEEVEGIKLSMKEEDERDDYFSRYSKNSARNIDLELLKDNYYYSLIIQIANSQEFLNSMTLTMIRDLAMNILIYGNRKQPTDDHGGWYPQRFPWVTARALIGLKNSGYELRNDKENIEEIVAKALDYLLMSIRRDMYWKSGVGDWVSDLESTAICLEAFGEWRRIKINKAQIFPIIKYFLRLEDEWLEPALFDSELKSNDTLASVTLLCTILEIIHENFRDEIEIDYAKYLNYLSKVLEKIEDSDKLLVRQYCTIPQIIYYITKVILTIENKKAYPSSNLPLAFS